MPEMNMPEPEQGQREQVRANKWIYLITVLCTLAGSVVTHYFEQADKNAKAASDYDCGDMVKYLIKGRDSASREQILWMRKYQEEHEKKEVMQARQDTVNNSIKHDLLPKAKRILKNERR